MAHDLEVASGLYECVTYIISYVMPYFTNCVMQPTNRPKPDFWTRKHKTVWVIATNEAYHIPYSFLVS